MFDSTDLDVTTAAYHEAGHVLMAHLLGGNVTLATIESEDEELQGTTIVRWHGLAHNERQRHSALVAIAGPIAEARWRGEAMTLDAFSAWQADWHEIQTALTALAEPDEQENLLRQWLGEVHRQLDDPHVWEGLCRVADALEAHATLDDDLLDDVLERS